MNKKTNIIIIIIFLSFLYLPFIISKFIKVESVNYENRTLASKPVLELKTIDSYPTRFNDYWNDNLPFRNTIKQLSSSIDYLLFDSSSSTNVILGKKDNAGLRWLFYNQFEEDNPIGDITGYKEVNKEEIDHIKDVINDNKELLGDKKLYYTIIPNKSSIYSEYLPSIYKVSNRTVTDIINSELQESDINSMYLKEYLKDKSKDNNTYYHLDTHWNNYGAFTSTDYVIKQMVPDFNSFDNYSLDTKIIKDFLGDLYKYNNSNVKMNDIEVKVNIDYGNDFEFESLGEGQGNIFISKNDNPYIDKKILILGDSFRFEMNSFYAHSFSEVMSMHRDNYSKKYLEEFDPDIVLVIGAERFSKSIYSIDLSISDN